ncbi:MAG TPA: ATP-binding protein, partial [Thermoguttaceae bacterium]|nr:ATP-binding protein [Thermoguttaceae bacterium]
LAYGGQAALDLAASERPDVILLDVMMPEIDGLDVLRRLKADPEMSVSPVILVTAKDLDEDVICGLDAGAFDYISKPFRSPVLAARLRAAVRAKKHHDAMAEVNQALQEEILERKRMELELSQAQKLESIGQLAAGIAHEINTPAQYIGDNTRFLQEAFQEIDHVMEAFHRLLEAARNDTVSDEMVRQLEDLLAAADFDYLTAETPKAIQQSLEGVERVATIVRAMKEFSHPGGEQKERIQLDRAIENTLTISRNEWKYVADVATDFDPSMPAVPCFPSDLNQVILNLVVNAAQAIDEAASQGKTGRGTITVSTRLDGDWAEIRVADTGTGIPEELRTKVFDHFFTTKEVGKGTGQGLTIVYRIVVEKHDGTIRFQTEVGKGTTFIIRLPLVAKAEFETTV